MKGQKVKIKKKRLTNTVNLQKKVIDRKRGTPLWWEFRRLEAKKELASIHLSLGGTKRRHKTGQTGGILCRPYASPGAQKTDDCDNLLPPQTPPPFLYLTRNIPLPDPVPTPQSSPPLFPVLSLPSSLLPSPIPSPFSSFPFPFQPK